MPIRTDAVGLETDCCISEITKRQCLAFAAALGETSEIFLTYAPCKGLEQRGRTACVVCTQLRILTSTGQ